MSILELTHDVRSLIFTKLDGAALGKYGCVCKTFKEDLEKFPHIWRNAFAYENDGYFPQEVSAEDWRKFYGQQVVVRRNLINSDFGNPKILETKRSDIIHSYFVCSNKFYYLTRRVGEVFSCYNFTTGAHSNRLKVSKDGEKPLEIRVFKSIDKTYYLVASYHHFSIINSKTDITEIRFTHLNRIVHVDGSRVIYNRGRGNLVIRDYTSRTLIKKMEGISPGQSGEFICSQLVGNILFALMKSIKNKSTIIAYDIEEGKQLYTIESKGDNPFSRLLATDKYLVALNPKDELYSRHDNFRISAGEEFQAFIYEPASGKLLHTIELVRNVYSPDKLFAIIYSNQLLGVPSEDSECVAFWNLETGDIDRSFRLEGKDIFDFKVGADRIVVSATPGNSVTIWNLRTNVQLCHNVHKEFNDAAYPGINIKIQNNILYYWRDWLTSIHFCDLITGHSLGIFLVVTKVCEFLHFDGARLIVSRMGGIEIYNLDQIQAPLQAPPAESKVLKLVKSIFKSDKKPK